MKAATKRRYSFTGKHLTKRPRVGVCACGCGQKFITIYKRKRYATRHCAWRAANRARDARRPVCSECGRKLPRTVKAKRNGRNRNGGRNGR